MCIMYYKLFAQNCQVGNYKNAKNFLRGIGHDKKNEMRNTFVGILIDKDSTRFHVFRSLP